MTPTLRKFGAATALAVFAAASGAAPKAVVATYIVQLREPPAASYAGGIASLAATQTAEGDRLDADAPAVRAYRSYLSGRRAAALASIGPGARLLQHYDLSYNGFAVRMTDAQAQRLRASGAARSVRLERRVHVDTVSTPQFLGLDAPGGAWSQLGGTLKGEDVIVASIDTGVQPENPSFYDQVDASGRPVASGGTAAYGAPPRRWKGTCQTGPGFPRSACNGKLIGARVFNTGFLAGGNQPWFGTYYNSPRDEGGHGSHTLATAGGNAMAPTVNSDGVPLGTASGMAPRARVVAYKALFNVVFNGVVGGSGVESDILAAIDAAVADGVDVINYSVSGPQDTLLDSIELAFLNASNAGIFVSTSAGNAGPGPFVAHPSPWLTTVAASNHDRNPYAKLTLGNGAVYAGASFNSYALPTLPLVLASSIPAPGVSAASAGFCAPASLDPAGAAGKLVVCDRSTGVTRLDKGNEVKRAGGAGMVLLNTPEIDDPLYPDVQRVPTVMLPLEARDPVRTYAGAVGASAGLGARYQVPGIVAPVMADFSSDGPNRADSSVMKPDLTGPGVSIVAASAYQQKNQAEHDAINAGTLTVPPTSAFLSGTSMSTPHVAGVAALLKQAHPRWSPAVIKSALLTSAGDVKLADGTISTDRVRFGAGHLNPNPALATPLVYPIQPRQYIEFLCGAGWYDPASSDCASVTPIAPQNLNLPSLAGEVVGQTVWQRTVRNVSGSPLTMTASASVPGFDATVEPAGLSIAPGRTAKFSVKLTTSGVASGQLADGALTWSDGAHRVTSPIQVRAIPIAAPGEVVSGETTGRASYSVTYGFSGNTATGISGLKAATATPLTVLNFEESCQPIELAQGLALFRAAVYNADQSVEGDFVLYLRNNVTSESLYAQVFEDSQTITVPSLAAGSYSLCFMPFLPNSPSLTTTINTWLLKAGETGGNLQVQGLPQGSVTLGARYDVTASWSGLDSGKRYLGVTTYGNSDGTVAGYTMLRVEPDLAITSQALRRGSAFAQTRTGQPSKGLAPTTVQARRSKLY